MEINDITSWAWEGLKEQALSNAAEAARIIAKEGTDAALTQIRKKWSLLKWPDSSRTYSENLRKNLSTTKVLGNPRSIEIERIYTDVYVHDKPSAYRRFSADIEQLNGTIFSDADLSARLPAINAVAHGDNLFILGRPGSGKTTFLKHLAILCCKNEIRKTPIFIPLKDWSDTSQDILDYISSTFDICGFPSTQPFVEALLSRGDALILLDGLDEVSDTNSERSQIIKSIVNFVRKYRKCQYCLTCRTAATDYSFEDFIYLEVADFTSDQQLQFVKQWYGDDEGRLQRFLDGWLDSSKNGLRDLGKTPLLLTLLCLAFDETLSFPQRLVDLYKDAIDALLRKWDTSRLIVRDHFYKNMSPSRREHLLESVAAHFYFESRVAFSYRELESQILAYLRQLPDKEAPDSTCAHSVIKQIEAQHGLIVERASGVFSFSHLTIQEYFTASHIVKMQDDKVLDQVAEQACRDPKWREVMLFSVGLTPRADYLLDSIVYQIELLKGTEPGLLYFLTVTLCETVSEIDRSILRHDPFGLIKPAKPAALRKAILKSSEGSNHPPLTGSEFTSIKDHIFHLREFVGSKSQKYNYSTAYLILNQAAKFIAESPQVASKLLGGYFAKPDVFISYLYGCRLLMECLEVAALRDRARFLSSIFYIDAHAVKRVADSVGYSGLE